MSMRSVSPGDLGILEHRFGDVGSYRQITYAQRAAFYSWEHTITHDQEFYRRFLPTTTTVLEVPCGAGKNLLWWAQNGCVATGVDLEPQMLAAARGHVHESEFDDQVHLVEGDMRDLALSGQFDLITVPADAFQFLMARTDVIACLESLHARLNPCGLLVLDIGMFDPARERDCDCDVYFDPQQPSHKVIFDWDRAIDDGARLTRFRAQDIQENHARFDFYYQLHRDGAEDRLHTSITLRRYTQTDDLTVLAAEAGLTLHQCFGDYTGAKKTRRSPRNILIFGRNGAYV